MSLFTRRHAVERLAAVGDVAGLREALADAAREGAGELEALRAAACALVDLGADGVGALVEAVLADPTLLGHDRIEDETFHRAAGPHAVALLSRALLHDTDREVRLAASGMLRRLGTTLADEAFAGAVSDPDPRVRLSAARGLADLGDDRGVRALLEWAAHCDNPVPALVGLARLGDPAVVPLLEQLRPRTSYAATAIDRTIVELRSHPAAAAAPVTRLEQIREHLCSIDLVDGLADPQAGKAAAAARRQLPVLCAHLERAVTSLRTGADPDEQPVTRTRVGVELAALVARSSGPEFDQLMAAVLQPRGVRALQEQMVALDVVATELQERQPAPEPGRGAGPGSSRSVPGSELRRGDPTIGV
jgi:hypothetical protein